MADDQVLYDQVDEEQFDEEDIIRYYFYYSSGICQLNVGALSLLNNI